MREGRGLTAPAPWGGQSPRALIPAEQRAATGEKGGPGSLWSLQYEAALITASALTLYFQQTHPLCESMSIQREKAMGQEGHSATPFIRTELQALEYLSFQTRLKSWWNAGVCVGFPRQGPLRDP